MTSPCRAPRSVALLSLNATIPAPTALATRSPITVRIASMGIALTPIGNCHSPDPPAACCTAAPPRRSATMPTLKPAVTVLDAPTEAATSCAATIVFVDRSLDS